MSVVDAAPTASRSGPGPEAPWTVLRMILWSADYLAEKGVPSARLDAEHLLAHVVGVSRLQLYLDFERPLTRDELDGYRPLLRRRAAREPLQYIIGRQPFRELDLEVGPAVLIPRPETELLVGEILTWLATTGTTDARALDIGTGSGAIALSLAFEGSFASVVATDIDASSLEVARRNRDAVHLQDRVDLRVGSLFEPLDAGERFDVIVSNPPYVADGDATGLQVEVRDWEPHGALFGGREGLDVIEAIVQGAGTYLASGGLLAVEVGVGQADVVVRLLEDVGGYRELRIGKDYSGKSRFVFAHGA